MKEIFNMRSERGIARKMATIPFFLYDRILSYKRRRERDSQSHSEGCSAGMFFVSAEGEEIILLPKQ